MTATRPAAAPSHPRHTAKQKRLSLAVKLALSTLLIPAAHAQVQAQDDNATKGNLPEVTVSAKKETTTTVITSEDMARSAVTDMAGVIRYQPLVTAPSAVSGAANLWDGTGTSGYNIRGVEGNRIGLDVDGVELPSSVPLPDGLKATGVGIGRDYIDPEMFRRVDISSGTTNAGENGATGLGGRVSFVTKSPDDYLVDGKTTYYGAKLGYTSADKAWAEALTAAAKVGDWKLLGVYSRRDGELTQPNGVNDPDTDSWHSDALLLKAIYGGLAHHKIGITLDMYERTDNRFLDGATYSAYPAGANQHSTTSRHRIQLDDEFTPAGGYALFDKLRTYAYYQDSKKDDYTVAANSTNTYTRYIDTYLSTTSTGIGADATKRLGAHDIFYGLSLNVLDEKRPWTEARYTNATGALVTGYPYTKDRMAATQTDKLVAYIRDDWHISPRATLTPGLRGEFWHTKPGDLTNYLTNVGTASSEIKSDNTAFLAPSLRFAYALTPTYDFYAQYSRGVRVATAAEKTGTYDSSTYSASAGFLYAILGNPDLKNETSDAFEIGTKGEIANGVTLNGSLFYTKYKNFIDYQSTTYAGVSPAYRLQNIANVDIWGGEVSTRFDLGAYASAMQGYSVGMAAGVSYGHSKNDDGKTGSVNSVGPAKGNIRLAYDDPAKRFGGSFIMSSARGKRASSDDVSIYSTSGAYFNVPGYTVFDLSTYWKLAKNVTLNAGIYNLTDKKYWDYATVRALTTSQSTLIQRAAQPGRNFGLTLNVEM